jgi:poly(hydroxyalkanoate) depolymerase family esterase
MYEYIPEKLAASPPIVVAAHYCGGSASAYFAAASSIVSAADAYGFIMIFPQTTNPATSAKCWEVGSKASLTHDGGGDTQAIAQMVEYQVAKRNADAGRVYIMGTSSGAMLTQAMLAVYPDVFKAGAEFSGVPAGCWSAGWSAASNWGGTCASGQESKSAEDWGDLVRAMYPGYMGPRPRVQLWHGTSDTTINFNNQTEAIKQWTNVLDLTMTPSSTDTTSARNFKIEKWQNACGFTLLEAHTESNGGHNIALDGDAVIGFFGLDKPGPDPQAACGSSGDAGAGGMGGVVAGSSGAGAAVGGANAGRAGVAGSSAVAGKPGVMLAGGGGRTEIGMAGVAVAVPLAGMNGAAAVAVPLAGMNGAATGAVGSSTNSLANNAASEPMPSSASSGCQCAIESRQGRSYSLGALLLTSLALLHRRRHAPSRKRY